MRHLTAPTNNTATRLATNDGPHRAGTVGLRAALALSVLLLAIGGCGGGAQSGTTAIRAPAPPATGTGHAPVTPSPTTAPVPSPAVRSAPRLRSVPAVLVSHGSRRRRWIALTFDADMTVGMRARLRDGRQRTWVDHALLQELHATRTPATIFLTGLWTQTYPAVVRELARDPLVELENHSLDHAAWETPCYGLPTVTTPAARRHELSSAQRIITRVAGRAPRLFRFPGVCHTAADVALVASLGLRPVDGDVISTNAFNPDPASIVRAVLAAARPGSIVIAHCIGAPNTPATAAAMKQIIPALRARGYRLVTLAQLLGLPARTEAGGGSDRSARAALGPTPG